MRHVHSIYDTDLHFLIDPIDRKIASESGKITLMQNDHNSERFTFEIPRYIEGHDMSLTDQVQIHYINLENVTPKRKYEDMYPVVDLQVSPDSEDAVIFSWLVSGNATQYVGSLSFLVRFVCYDEDSNVEYQWWSDTCSTIKIGATFDNSGSTVDFDYTDTLESWRQQCIQAVFESEVFKTLEEQGSSYVQQAKVYAEQAKEISGLDTVEPLLANVETYGSATLGSTGWYRIAEYTSDKESSAYGAGSNMCDVIIKRGYSSTLSEYHVVRFRSVYKQQEFISLDDKSAGHLITKIRHVVDTVNHKSYIDVYYNANASNGFYCIVQSGKDRHRLWSALTPALVADTSDDTTITTTYDIPANAVPMNSISMKETGIASAAHKLNWKVKGGNKEGVTYIKLCSRVITGAYQFADTTFLLSQPYAGTYYNAIVDARVYMGKTTLTINLTQIVGLDISDRLFYEQISDTEAGTETINFYLKLNNYETVYGYILGSANMDIPSAFPELSSINYTGTGSYQALLQHTHQPDEVGLENVDNTSDANKPVSTAQQTAIDNAKTEAKNYTDTKVANLINGAPSTLDTLKEIADAMAENEDVVEALDAAIGTKAEATHNHTKSEITDFPTTMPPEAHNQAASTITAGTFNGKVNANASAMATLINAQLRDGVILSSDPGEGASVSYNPGTIVFYKK